MKFLRIALLAALLLPLSAAVDGTVTNKTTGQPQAGVSVKLVKLAEDVSATSVNQAVSDASGRFAFEETLTGIHGLEAEFQGVSYSQVIPPMLPPTNLQVSVYEQTRDSSAVALDQQIFFLEPGQSHLVVSESYVLKNETQRTYRDPSRGSLQFYLPPEAKGIVQVSFIGPDQRPRLSEAKRTGQADTFRVDDAVPPGESRVDLSYVVPYDAGSGVFRARTQGEPGRSRVVVPQSVVLAADELVSLGVEPRTKAQIFGINGENVAIRVSGSGAIAEAAEPTSSEADNSPRIRATAPALHDNLPLITAAGALAMIFALVLLYRRPQSGAPIEGIGENRKP